MNQNILVAVDGSAASQSSAKLAIHLAQLYHDSINGLYVVDSDFITESRTEFQAELETGKKGHSRSEIFSQFQAQGNQLLDQLADDCLQSGVPAAKELVFGSVNDVIQARGESFSFLSLGRRGRRHAEDPKSLGRNFRKILHSFKKPIIVGGQDPSHIHRILLTYPDHASLDRANDLIPLVVGPLLGDTAIRESQERAPEKNSDQAQPSAQELLSTYDVIQIEGKSADEIIAEAAKHDVDLLLLAGYHHHATLPWTRTVIEEVLLKANYPTIIL